jgi:DNA invertase Pin-like site-specific DNA recombinase
MSLRVGLYARVSTSSQDLELQLEELRRFASARGWELDGEYTDVISGATRKRPGLDRLMSDAHRRRFDVVLAWKLDRLGRSLVHVVHTLEELLSRGIEVVSATEPHMDSTTPQGRLLRNIFASVAEYERELIRERVVAGIRRAQARGVRFGRPRVHHVDVERARVLRASGQSFRKIGAALGGAHPLHPSAVRSALIAAG